MLLDQLRAQCLDVIPVVLCILIVSKLLYNKYGTGLKDIPGPLAASFTDIWRLRLAWNRRPEVTHRQLHEQYGEVVRLGPNAVSVSNWEGVKKIYALKSGYDKSGFYPVQQTISKGRALHSLFNTTNKNFHAKLRRSVANAYSMSNLIQFEPLVDSTITAFTTQLENRAVDKPGDEGVIDLGTWLQFYAFDVIGELTFSQRLGFVDQGKDIDGIMAALEKLLDYVAVIGQMPWLDRLFLKNPITLWLNDKGLLNTSSPVVTFAKARMASRVSPSIGNEKREESAVPPRDFLARFLEANKKDPEFISNERVLALTVANIFAGSDTTAITLRAVFYFLLKNPPKLAKLMDELTAADLGSKDDIVSWESARSLPYLSAVIQESLRMHPAVGLTLERIVPAQGLKVNGHFIPPGTIVGATAWAVHAKESIFGAQPLEYRPERWLEVSDEKRAEMNNALFSFGMGARTCIGKNISLLEMYKLVPTILRRYDLSLANPDINWTLHNAWFVKQSDFFVRINSKPN
ncbi:hypothetical protein VF21_04908 [Pseudogymnoascus sp. 05NY08]|nr:hypothetical protein VF21_04908 [Pseudogymnoascus sp. 05NY08]